MEHNYQDIITLIERLHRYFLDVVKVELDRLGIEDVNSAQALILFNIGKKELTVGELVKRGYYLGANISYNVKKMAENAYLVHERSTLDRRSNCIRLSDKGLVLYDKMTVMFEHHIAELDAGPATMDELKDAAKSLRHLGEFWDHVLRVNQCDSANVSVAPVHRHATTVSPSRDCRISAQR